MKVKNATEAFEKICYDIVQHGIERNSPKGRWWSLFNYGIEIINPINNVITTPWRKFKLDYAKIELEWYLSKDRSASFIEKHASMWTQIKDERGMLNSNYGYLMWENDQWDNAIKRLKSDKISRQAIITLYDGKKFLGMDSKDIPCTLNIGFRIVREHLNMTVVMRSQDAYFGFCNDQYCFSEMQRMMASELNIPIGTYHNFAMDIHLYERHFFKVKDNILYSK